MYENEEILTTQQQQVLTLIAQGSTVSAAADAAGVHRNTVANWRRAGSNIFRKSWDAAQFEQAAYWRDRVQALGDLAIEALHQILVDPKASPSVRLKAATTVLNTIASATAAKTAQSAQRSEANSDFDRMIAQAGHIPPEWRAQAEASIANSSATPTTPINADPSEHETDEEMTEIFKSYLKRVRAGELPSAAQPAQPAQSAQLQAQMRA